MADERDTGETVRPRTETGGEGDGVVDAHQPGGRPGPTWRALFLSILAAVVLSVAATLLLGGSFRLPGASKATAGGCGAGAGGPCCPLPGEEAR